jgi:hypothetical protein
LLIPRLSPSSPLFSQLFHLLEYNN